MFDSLLKASTAVYFISCLGLSAITFRICCALKNKGKVLVEKVSDWTSFCSKQMVICDNCVLMLGLSKTKSVDGAFCPDHKQK